jgi:hypothetical protein
MTSLFRLLIAFPGFLESCEKITSWILTEIRYYRENQLKEKFSQDLPETLKTKDTSAIDTLFGGKDV